VNLARTLLAELDKDPSRPALRSGAGAWNRGALRRAVDERASRLASESASSPLVLDAAEPARFLIEFLAARAAKRTALVRTPGCPEELHSRRLERISREPVPQNCTIFFSSGSVGEAKAIPLTDENLFATALAFESRGEVSPSDRVAVATSPAHIFGLVRGCLDPLLHGAEVAFLSPRRDPLGEAEALGATIAVLPGRMVALAARHSRVSGLRAVLSGGAALALEDLNHLETVRGVPVRLGYGLTESAGLGTRQPLLEPRHPRTSGPPAPGMRIVIVSLDSERDLAAGETGEIRLAGPAVFSGYAGPGEPDPFDSAGRLKSGDLGYLDPTGELVVRGRTAFCVALHGRLVCAEEIEAALQEHPAVAEAAVAGTEASLGAVLVARPGFLADRVEIGRHVERRLPGFARPRRLVFADHLPRTLSGKIDRRAVAEQLA
jgi:long-chain acyl-CoA synthetase